MNKGQKKERNKKRGAEKKRQEQTRPEKRKTYGPRSEEQSKNKILCLRNEQDLFRRTYRGWRRGCNQRVQNMCHVSQCPLSCFVSIWWRFLCGSSAPDSNTLSLSRQRCCRTADCVKEGFVQISHLLFVRISGKYLLSS